ncbi:hypothetical protein BaRGS_00032732, partial [Batillaria attramentaria]
MVPYLSKVPSSCYSRASPIHCPTQKLGTFTVNTVGVGGMKTGRRGGGGETERVREGTNKLLSSRDPFCA